MISSDSSTTDAQTLNHNQKGFDIQPDLPPDLPLDLPSQELISALPQETSSVLDESQGLNSLTNNNCIPSEVVLRSHQTVIIAQNPSTGDISNKDSPAEATASSSATSSDITNKNNEEDPDTGVFFDSGSSGVSSDLREAVADALNEESTVKSQVGICNGNVSPDSVIELDESPSDGGKSKRLSMSSDTTNGTVNKDAVEGSDHVHSNERKTTDSGCICGNTSFDSSPEPHVPPYSGIFGVGAAATHSGENTVWCSAESMAYSANLAFPEWTGSVHSSAPHSPHEHTCCSTPHTSSAEQHNHHQKSNSGSPKVAIFNVDLGEMRSLRLFFSDTTGTRGQLVIASRECQYKILHFHHTGLDKLAAVFEDWNFLVPPRDGSFKLLKERMRGRTLEEEDSEVEEATKDSTREAFKQFSVCRPSVPDSELHPDEGSVPELDAEDWLSYFTKDGVIEDDLGLRRRIFHGGLEAQLRSSVWPFLLRCYPYASTFTERQALSDQNKSLYSQLTEIRENLQGSEKEKFWRSIQCTVEKDVVRTDRNNPCFAGHDNPNLTKMKNILLNFALHRPDIGYTQGMSDILAPILSEVRCEPDVFWCFTGLMSKTIFVTSPRDWDMEKNLLFLRELLRLMAPEFHDHITNQQDGKDLLFCHRWILLCFKREFPDSSVLSLWEACWSNYQTDYFHLFVAVAIVCVYGKEVSLQNLRPDETLLYFTSLAYHMDATIVIKKARGLLHYFRSLSQIPCSLVGLCELCGPGMWDSGHNPTVECVGHDSDDACPGDLRPELKNKWQ